MAAQKHEIDMLHGPLAGKIIAFALPIAASSFLQQMFNAADVAVVGQFAGSNSLAAVGANSFIISLMVNLFVGLSVGANVVLAGFRGQGDDEGASKTVHTSVLLSLLCGCFLLVCGMLLATPIHQAVGTPAELLDKAVLYFRIYFAGMPFVMLYNFESAILRSKGDTRRPLVVLACSGVLNVLLNLLFVIAFRMDVAGVATATVISNVFSSIVLLIFLRREPGSLRLEWGKLRIDGEIVKRIARIGIPAGVQSTVFSLANVILQSAVNSLGAAAIAGTTVAMNFEFFSYDMVIGFSQAATTFVGQNYGAKNWERCRQSTRLSVCFGAAGTLLLSLLFFFLKRPLVGIFTTDPAVVDIAYQRIALVTCFQAVNGVLEITSGSMRGMKQSVLPAAISILGICGIRVLWVYTGFRASPTYPSLMTAYPLSWFITAGVMVCAYFLVRRRAFSPAESGERGDVR